MSEFVLFHREEAQIDHCCLLSPSQLSRLRRGMESAHRFRRVPVGDAKFMLSIEADHNFDKLNAILVDDTRLLYIWNRFRQRAIEVVGSISETEHGARSARQIVAFLCSRASREALALYRRQYDRRTVGSDSIAKQLRQSIVKSALACVESREDRDQLESLFGD